MHLLQLPNKSLIQETNLTFKDSFPSHLRLTARQSLHARTHLFDLLRCLPAGELGDC